MRVAVIGCGAISHEHLGFLSSSPRVELVSVCDRSPASATFARQRYGAHHASTDAAEVLASDLDVVHVLTPPETHPDLVEAAIDAGAHVVVEKPMAPTAGETARLLEHSARAGRSIVESHNLLFNDPVLAVGRLVRSGRLGSLREVDILLSLDLTAGPFGDLNLDGPGVELPAGAVHDYLPHLGYLFLHFASDAPLDAVTGRLGNLSGNPRVGFDHLDVLVTAGDVRGRLRLASDLAPDTFRLVVRGTSGWVETDLYNPYLRIADEHDGGRRGPLEQLRSGTRLALASFTNARDKVLQHTPYHGLPRMLDAVYAALQTGQQPPITPRQILATAELADRVVSLAEVRS